jgi:hypothetical protein
MDSTDSRLKKLVFQSIKRKSQMGSKAPAGAHMFHAATGVSDGGRTNDTKSVRLKKAFARLRSAKKADYDEGTHSYLLDHDKQA